MQELKRWWQDLMRTPLGRFGFGIYKRITLPNVPLLAASLAYYAAFSLGPLLLLLASGLGFLLNDGLETGEFQNYYRDTVVNLLEQLLPLVEVPSEGEAADLDPQVLFDNGAQAFQSFVGQLQQGATLRSIISFFVLLWASSNFFAALQYALERIFNSQNPRGYWRKRLIAVLLVILVALIIVIEVIGGFIFSFFAEINIALSNWFVSIGFPPIPFALLQLQDGLLTEGIRALIAILAFALCFRLLPRYPSSWLGSFAGAIFSTGSIVILRELLQGFFNFNRFNLLYGVITSLVVVLLWLYVALLLFLIGAVVAAEVSQWRSRGEIYAQTTGS